jgi:replicative DNA helicase Mcm
MRRAEGTELIEDIEQFYRRYYTDEIGTLAQNYPDEQRSLYVDWTDLYRYDADLADDFISQPQQLREYAEEALRLYDLPVDVSLGQANVRLKNLDRTTNIGEIRSRHVHNLLAIRGTVETASEVHSELLEAAFQCQRCGTLTYIPQDPHSERQEPHECQGCERQGPFEINYDQSEVIDSQTIVVEQRHFGVGTDDDSKSIIVELNDDLAGSVMPGDTVRVNGVVHLESEGEFNEGSISDKYINAHSVEEASPYHIDLTNDHKQKIVKLSNSDNIYEQMVESMAPSIYGYEQEKLALILQLFSGVTKHLPDETRIRGDIHVGFVGDPGTAKSKLIRYAARLAPRAVRVSGKNSSSVGLTAAATKKNSGKKAWTFEAGVLPMADEGMACIDNLTDLSGDNQRALHDVMEDQVVELSKGSATDSLKARASVLAAGNPKYGRFDQYEPVDEQVDIEPGLLSQFDLLFTVTDSPDEEEDEKMAESILQTNYAGEMNAQRTEMSAPNLSEEEVKEAMGEVIPAIDSTLLRKYIVYARENCFPTMTDEAKQTIKDFFTELRSKGEDEDAPVPVTARKLEAMVRLAEASARVRLSDIVEHEDAKRAVDIVQSCLQDIGIDPETGQFDADVVETGVSKSQRDRIKNIMDLVREIDRNSDNGVPEEKVLEEAEKIGMERAKAAHEIERLKSQGEIYTIKQGHIRPI